MSIKFDIYFKYNFTINEFRLLNLRYKSYRNIYFIRFKKKVTLS